MTLSGYFDNISEAPYIDAEIALPDLGIVDDIPFLLDTGADTTFLMADDASHLGIDFGRLALSSSLGSGVGGDIPLYRTSASITFSDQERVYVYHTDLAIAQPGEHNRGLPSLLGRDILNRWLVRYEAPRNVLEAEVDTADLVIPRRR